MADETPQEQLEELQPLDPDVVSADEALAASEASVAAEDEATVLVEPAPAPLGQTIAMDFEEGSVIVSGGAPLLVRRELALYQWIEKCLRTHQGAHPIHALADGYGVTEPLTDLIGLSGGAVQTGEVEDAVREALLFHPAISDVTDFEAEVENPDSVSGDASLELKFTVLTDDGSVLPVTTTVSGEALA